MGDVRSALADPVTSPIKKIVDIREQIYDLIQIKRRDLVSEGTAMKDRNERSITALQQAVEGLNSAELALKTY